MLDIPKLRRRPKCPPRPTPPPPRGNALYLGEGDTCSVFCVLHALAHSRTGCFNSSVVGLPAAWDALPAQAVSHVGLGLIGRFVIVGFTVGACDPTRLLKNPQDFSGTFARFFVHSLCTLNLMKAERLLRFLGLSWERHLSHLIVKDILREPAGYPRDPPKPQNLSTLVRCRHL